MTAGNEVAYAFALLRCGTPQELADNPETRLRLALGLRKQQGRWAVAHEHPLSPTTAAEDLRSGPVVQRDRHRAQLVAEASQHIQSRIGGRQDRA